MTPGRDARHHALAAIGAAGQARIAAGSVLLIGVGGIGCAAAAYLAAGGVGRLMLSDFDTVDETNLGRQFLFTPDDIGKLKTEVAAARLQQQHPGVECHVFTDRLADDRLLAAVADADLVLDGSDNFATRFATNAACVATGTRLISGSAIRLEGQLAVFGADYRRGPCYRCLYDEADESLDSCSGNGVLSPVPGVIGTMMAVEALKSLAGHDVGTSKLQLYDAAASEFRMLTFRKRANCPECAT